MTQQRKKYLQQAGILLAVYLFLRYLLPLGMPFFLAWLTVHFLVFLQKWIRMRLLPLGICFLAVVFRFGRITYMARNKTISKASAKIVCALMI